MSTNANSTDESIAPDHPLPAGLPWSSWAEVPVPVRNNLLASDGGVHDSFAAALAAKQR